MVLLASWAALRVPPPVCPLLLLQLLAFECIGY
jgi:hypothetical protein